VESPPEVQEPVETKTVRPESAWTAATILGIAANLSSVLLPAADLFNYPHARLVAIALGVTTSLSALWYLVVHRNKVYIAKQVLAIGALFAGLAATGWAHPGWRGVGLLAASIIAVSCTLITPLRRARYWPPAVAIVIAAGFIAYIVVNLPAGNDSQASAPQSTSHVISSSSSTPSISPPGVSRPVAAPITVVDPGQPVVERWPKSCILVTFTAPEVEGFSYVMGVRPLGETMTNYFLPGVALSEVSTGRWAAKVALGDSTRGADLTFSLVIFRMDSRWADYLKATHDDPGWYAPNPPPTAVDAVSLQVIRDSHQGAPCDL
jgi:hypothetical protein